MSRSPFRFRFRLPLFLPHRSGPNERTKQRRRKHNCNSFSAVQKDLLIPALVLAFVPIVASLLTHNFKLTKVQNVVEAIDLTGQVVDVQHPELIREKVNGGKV